MKKDDKTRIQEPEDRIQKKKMQKNHKNRIQETEFRI